MACGLPVIVTDMTGAADLVREDENGFIVLAGRADLLREKVKFLYEHQEIRKKMGWCARETVTEGQTWDDYGTRLAVFLAGVVDRL